MADERASERTTLLHYERSSSQRSANSLPEGGNNYFAPQNRLQPTTSNERMTSSDRLEVVQPIRSQSPSGRLTPPGMTYGAFLERTQTRDSAVTTSDEDSDDDSRTAPPRAYSHLRSSSNFRISHNEHRIQPPDLVRGLLVILQSLDTAALTTHAYPLSLAIFPEADDQVVSQWNKMGPWLLRSLTQFCAPGFMFLVGLGVVYLARSRAQSGWNRWQYLRYFVLRAMLFGTINVILSFIITGAQPMILNTFLITLAINYLAVGFFYLFITFTEKHITSSLLQPLIALEDEDQARESLLRRGFSFTSEPEDPQLASRHQRNLARTISFHFHNILIIIGTGLLFCVPMWTSPTGGHCTSSDSYVYPNSLKTFLLFPMKTKHFVSPFPPVPYLPYAMLGLLYTRIVLPRKTAPKQKPPNLLRPGPSPLGFSAGAGKKKPAFWNRSPSRLSLFDLMLGLTFAILFVCTRVLRFGNLSEGCLKTPEHLQHPNSNAYLKGFRSFFYTTAYPPSPSHGFLCMTIIFLMLSLTALVPSPIETIKNRALRLLAQTLNTFGQTSLLFFTVHIPVYCVLGLAARGIFGKEESWRKGSVGAGMWMFGLMAERDHSDIDLPVGAGEYEYVKLVGVNMRTFFVDWVVGLVIMWLLCSRYHKFRFGKGADSWWRFF